MASQAWTTELRLEQKLQPAGASRSSESESEAGCRSRRAEGMDRGDALRKSLDPAQHLLYGRRRLNGRRYWSRTGRASATA
ncbi:hypothetical protein AK812_SmicGene27944 [Symbiodinium microadriaticum]|uniref:Uncharacterized protein n=1 Tax=Symbiodinium microadriaticum TaxID=2951 RepID=A0A1Q9D5N7_SYMMI|nr:hypothetical protein AK812_SmicGene27944 [Symbiodinium microadriaticum]